MDIILFLLLLGLIMFLARTVDAQTFAEQFQFNDQTLNDPTRPPAYTADFFMDISNQVNFRQISNSDHTYFIVDPDLTRMGSDDMSSLRDQGKIILAYLSIGEADARRDYWQPNWVPGVTPTFLEFVNPALRDRYKVRFWMSEWQNALLEYLRTHILLRGFSGLYLDAVDVYSYFLQKNVRPTASDDMVRLMATIRRTALMVNPDILIFPSNAVELYGNTDYISLVDGLVVENTWYKSDTPQSVADPNHTKFVLQFLKQARADAKIIFAADFPVTQSNVCDFYVKCSTEVFRCAVFEQTISGAINEKNC